LKHVADGVGRDREGADEPHPRKQGLKLDLRVDLRPVTYEDEPSLDSSRPGRVC
jgi:hypothetical protein